MKIGIIREEKNPPDKRVPLSPAQCAKVLSTYKDLELVVQPSRIRAYPDEEYVSAGIQLQEDLSDCEVLMGVKEVPIESLLENKTYLFFSHTYKLQPYNRDLLKAILDKKIRLIDYEMLREQGGKRLIGFGRYAGIVGAYNAFRAYGEMTGNYSLKPAHECFDRREMEGELIKVKLPKTFKIALTGAGRVAGGAMEILSALRITHVTPGDFLEESLPEPIFAQLDIKHYFKRKDEGAFSRQEFYTKPEDFKSNFMPYAKETDMYIPCHFWSDRSPFIFTRDDAKNADFRIKLVADISCDIDGPVASTLRPSTIEEPFYGYDPQNEKETTLGAPGSIGVCAVDNLPCELPRDASEDFGNELIKNVLPQFFNGDNETILARASETNLKGELTPSFAYLSDYVKGEA
jgi:saccharopine dehydrogenase (NAD+, L-lysine-forming)